MGQEVKIPIIPGGENSDISSNELGNVRHQIVKNFRLIKEAEWETVRGYINSKTGATDIRAACEIYDDVSGARFILYQDSYGASCLKTLTYDSGDGDGYQNETPATLTLPSGVTIGDVTLKFFYHQGVVRIAGGSHPLWYGHASGDFCPDAWRLLAEYSFETGITGWGGNDATAAQYDCDVDPDGAGMGDGEYGDYALRAEQTALNGCVYMIIGVKSGISYNVRSFIFGAGGPGTFSIRLSCGTTIGGSEYGSETSLTTGVWQDLDVA